MDERFFGRMKKPDGEPAHTKMARFIEEATEESENGPTLGFNVDAVSAYLEFTVPEPEIAGLLVLSGLAIGFRRRRG